MENEENTPAQAAIVDPIAKIAVHRHSSLQDALCLQIVGVRTGQHFFSATASDLMRMTHALRDVAEGVRAVPVPPTAVAPAELAGAAEHAERVIADWTVAGGTLQALAMGMTALIARQVEQESGRAAAVELFAALAEMVRQAPPLDEGAPDRRH